MIFERRDTGLLQRYEVMIILSASVRQVFIEQPPSLRFFYHNRSLLFHTARELSSRLRKHIHVMLQTGSLHCRLPRKNMQRELQLSADIGYTRSWFSIHVQLGMADSLITRGVKIAGVNLWIKGAKAARVPFQGIGEGLSPYPFVLVFPQDTHERLLIERLFPIVHVYMRSNVMRQAGTSESQYHLGVSPTSRDRTSSVIIMAMDSMMSPRTEIFRNLFGARQREKRVGMTRDETV